MRTKLFILILVLAALGGFYAGWWYRGRTHPSVEDRIHEETERLRDATRALTR
jgi:hypothetical protein